MEHSHEKFLPNMDAKMTEVSIPTYLQCLSKPYTCRFDRSVSADLIAQFQQFYRYRPNLLNFCQSVG